MMPLKITVNVAVMNLDFCQKTLITHSAENKLLPTQLGKGALATYFLYSSR